jgi:thiamine biosynthesis lipoprotein ApbE
VLAAVAGVVVVGGSPELADAATRRVADLKARWSRFLPTSELSVLNAARGAPCVVSADALNLVEHLVRAWYESAGRFDPKLHDVLVGLSYSGSWPISYAPSDAGL